VSWLDPPEHGRARTRRCAPLLDLDPDLARLLPPDRRDAARRDVHVRLVGLRRGPWRADALAGADESHVGLLVLDGLLGRELVAEDVASLELLGPGDLLRPWEESADADLLHAVVRWSALADTRLAIIDRNAARRLGRYPEVYCALLERCAARSRRLAIGQAISQLNRVDRRVLALLWHLAERWGRVTPDGVVVPLALSHRMLAQLVGARRPSVSSAVSALGRAGEMTRAADGTWILTGSPVGSPVREGSDPLPRRRVTASSRPVPVAS
jgi:CRP/FNR family transcriptional regulator, cyclic AMP receptor protein